MKLYVWEGDGVLTEHTDGMICVLAESLEQALSLIREKYDYCMTSFPADRYKVIEQPEAFLCWGGG